MGLFKDPFGARENVTESIDEYGPLSMPPSAEAGAILAAMSEEEKANFSELLRRLQEELESHANKDKSVKVHFEGRAAFWGIAFGKIADHYRDIGRDDKAMFFSSTAWNVSKFPVFVFNMALLAFLAEDYEHARTLFQTYLSEYRTVLTSPKWNTLNLVGTEWTEEELEKLAESARAKITAIDKA
jgi:TolA-binding protein